MEGYRTKDYGQPVKRYVQTMELKDNPELCEELEAKIMQAINEKA